MNAAVTESIPAAPSTAEARFTHIPAAIFSREICEASFEIPIAFGSFQMSLSITSTSADMNAASEPSAPIAIPTSTLSISARSL